MTSFEFERWDAGRLIVNAQFAAILRANSLTSFAAFEQLEDEEVVKSVRPERSTSRFLLEDKQRGTACFYLKRFDRHPWKEFVKPLLRLTWPVLGAQPEWDAILEFHAIGVRTMVPVALGQSRGRSLLVTEGIEGYEKLSEWLPAQITNGDGSKRSRCDRATLNALAGTAQQIHAHQMHHQDFYLGHLMRSGAGQICVIDLGRVRRRTRLGRRWIVKDLAQLDFSAHFVCQTDRLRFLRAYLGRKLRNEDRDLVRSIRRKSSRIARHSRKNKL